MKKKDTFTPHRYFESNINDILNKSVVLKRERKRERESRKKEHKNGSSLGDVNPFGGSSRKFFVVVVVVQILWSKVILNLFFF